MNVRELSAWSIRNPVIPIILFIGLMVAGLVSFNRMTVINFPEVDFPAVTINVSQPGAGDAELFGTVFDRCAAAVFITYTYYIMSQL